MELFGISSLFNFICVLSLKWRRSHRMKVKEISVREYLEKFLKKLARYKIVFLNRRSSRQVMIELDIDAREMTGVIQELKEEDFESGRNFGHSETEVVWSFQTKIAGKRVRIEVSLGMPETPVICHHFDLI